MKNLVFKIIVCSIGILFSLLQLVISKIGVNWIYWILLGACMTLLIEALISIIKLFRNGKR